MVDLLRATVLAGSLFIPEALLANTGVVRGGEHGDFTRLTFTTEQPVLTLEKDEIGSATYRLLLTPAVTKLDTTRMFDRIGRDRISNVLQTARGIEILLNCTCNADVVQEGAQLIIVDIRDDTEPEILQVPELPYQAGAFPKPFDTRRPDQEPFSLDHSVLERINRTVSAQLGEMSHVKGFSALALASTNSAAGKTNGLMRNVDIPMVKPPDRCSWSDRIWNDLQDRTEGSALSAQDGQTLEDWVGFDDTWSLYVGSAAQFLSEGRLEEARMAFLLSEPPTEREEEYEVFEKMLMGSADTGSYRFGDCNPFDDVLIATTRHPFDVPNPVKLSVINTLSELPIGLQVVLYPRLESFVEQISPNAFPELHAHHLAEIALTQRKQEEKVAPGSSTDPDGLAALSVELRGTEREIESWQAAFESYLNHERYFDALNALFSDAPLVDKDREHAATTLVDRLVADADSITFVQIALAAVPTLEPAPSRAALARLEERLVDEGFDVPGLLMEQSDPPTDQGQADIIEAWNSTTTDTTFPNSAVEDNLRNDAPVEKWTVALARERVAAAERLREDVLERLSR
ncbi:MULTISPECIES: hypothetical protein [Marivita]|uniref:Uncharacterized protein n=1 Tax=Marivita cryptomonadis TaxID=505252 RepID=A0A9Q2P7T1_9RHOB|nr:MULTISPECIES: hypothetical protein [Marivita]MCR9168633.1 hypothetical protein [Paracoccaceae bacterium]MBM2323799.1 hypothetical protein [Marivita cryptomonadis]MBM2333388.1 hypothetical protein [Marivita cryptomonadis]MBM2342966.1 hypothetical protein [Marivita cryptomonadis]MBM2347637.1 hypothetical protein [Marivita cryptomonadis]